MTGPSYMSRLGVPQTPLLPFGGGGGPGHGNGFDQMKGKWGEKMQFKMNHFESPVHPRISIARNKLKKPTPKFYILLVFN
jgi:hypothetical protein